MSGQEPSRKTIFFSLSLLPVLWNILEINFTSLTETECNLFMLRGIPPWLNSLYSSGACSSNICPHTKSRKKKKKKLSRSWWVNMTVCANTLCACVCNAVGEVACGSAAAMCRRSNKASISAPEQPWVAKCWPHQVCSKCTLLIRLLTNKTRPDFTLNQLGTQFHVQQYWGLNCLAIELAALKKLRKKTPQEACH